jgi:hypothetical protein
MCTISWEAGQHRLRLAGECTEDDKGAVEDALATYGEQHEGVLIIDLTGVRTLAPEVAEVIVAACDHQDRCRVNVLRRHGTQVDRVLSEVGE